MANREQLIRLRKAMGLTQTGIAELIEVASKRPCALRTVQAWEARTDLLSARTCPSWALDLIREAKVLAVGKEDARILHTLADARPQPIPVHTLPAERLASLRSAALVRVDGDVVHLTEFGASRTAAT